WPRDWSSDVCSSDLLGWSYDRSGINELPAPAVTDFQEAMKRNVDSLLRFRLNEPGLTIRFGGSDTVDLKQVQWVELDDSEGRKYRLAVDTPRIFWSARWSARRIRRTSKSTMTAPFIRITTSRTASGHPCRLPASTTAGEPRSFFMTTA